MPEIAEVETVRLTLKERILNKTIKDIHIYYEKIILDNPEIFTEKLIGETIKDIKRIGKWLIFETDNYYLLSHLRMEGKYFIKNSKDELVKHEHIEFVFTDSTCLRYHDTRKFGRMKLMPKDKLYEFEGIKKQGIEPLSDDLTADYLYEKFHPKNIPMKTLLLDQTIISGLGNIYADEVLFASKVNPFKKGNQITKKDCERIVASSNSIIKNAIKEGGTTIRSYTSSLGVRGRFQNYLMVHKKEGEKCSICSSIIQKEFIGGRSTYYCPKCQKVKKTIKA